MVQKNTIRVLIVDDSVMVRKILSDLLGQDPSIEVVGTASDGAFALHKVKTLQPDVVTLDVEMPKKSGLELLPELMAAHPVPVIMVSGVTEKGAKSTIKALELGAVDFVTKPGGGAAQNIQEIAAELTRKIKAVVKAGAKTRTITRSPFTPPPRVTLPPLPAGRVRTGGGGTVIGLGASTGGTEALREVLVALPPQMPPIVVVQHMPPGFTSAFANRLDGLAALNIKEAQNNDLLEPGKALIAPGHSHLVIKQRGNQYVAQLDQSDPVMRHRPSVDVLFHSLAREVGRNCIAVIMTGMGADGARGMSQIRQTGGKTIAQDEQSCVVFGMPKEAIDLGGAAEILPLNKIAGRLVEMVHRGSAQRTTV